MAEPINYIRRLTIALMISGALNIGLAVLFFYGAFNESPPSLYYELKQAGKQDIEGSIPPDYTNGEVIRYFKRMPREWLVSRLNNTQLVENGYTQRDLALAILRDSHYFDLESALVGFPPPSQKRTITYGKYKDGRPAELIVFPGLTDKHFDAISAFAKRERWPLTNQGLFVALKKEKSPSSSLVETFYMTQEFQSVESLFAQVDRAKLLEVILQGDWNTLAAFSESQKNSQEMGAGRRQRFLLEYVGKGSRAAAYLMLETDNDFALRKLDDTHTAQILQLLDEKSPEVEKFAKMLLASPRSDHVWKLAAARVQEQPKEKVEWPKKTVVVPTPKVAAPKVERQHIVQDGDTLWKIAQKYKVDVQKLKTYNQLENDKLRTGKVLRIP